MPIYGAICYALYSLDVMSKDSAIGCFIAMATVEPNPVSNQEKQPKVVRLTADA